jgi:hypothetical protein
MIELINEFDVHGEHNTGTKASLNLLSPAQIIVP